MRYWLCIPGGRSLVLDPLEYLFAMHRHVLWCVHPKTDLIATHAKDRHDDVRTDPNNFANSPREYQHQLPCLLLGWTIIAVIPPLVGYRQADQGACFS
jgi:hypothetical protein